MSVCNETILHWMLMNKKFQTISNYKTYNLHKNMSTTNVNTLQNLSLVLYINHLVTHR